MLTHPTGLFSEDCISAPRGRWPLKFLHALDTGPCLLAHTKNRVGGPPKNFKGEHLKLGLKFHICAPITLGVVGITSQFYQGMWLIAGVITLSLILQGVPPTKFGRVKKRPKFSAIFDNCRIDHKYLRNGSTYRKSEMYLINYILSPIG